jgi:tetratricopeptide (TPR) repeat protein
MKIIKKKTIIPIILLVLAVGCTVGGTVIPADLTANCEKADKLIQEGKYPEARSLFEECVKKYVARYPRLYCSIGSTYWAEQNLEKALESFKKAAELIPEDPDIQVRLGVLYSELSRKKESEPGGGDEAERTFLKKEAEQAFRKAEKLGSTSHWCLAELAGYELRRGKFNSAAGFLDKAHENFTRAAGFLDKAIAAARNVLSKDLPQTAKKEIQAQLDGCLLRRAMLAQDIEKDFSYARILLSEYLGRHEDDVHVWEEYVRLLIMAAREEEALAKLSAAIDRLPAEHGLFMLKIEIMMRLDMGAQALDEIEKKLTKEPEKLPLHMVKARVLAALEKIKEAKAHLEELKSKYPDAPEVVWYSSMLLLREGEHDKALNAIGKALEKHPGNLNLITLASSAYLMRRDTDGLITFLEGRIEHIKHPKNLEWLKKNIEYLKHRPPGKRALPDEITEENFLKLDTKSRKQALEKMLASRLIFEQHVKVYLKAAEDADAIVRTYALKGLALSGRTKETLAAIQSSLSDADENVRAQAISCYQYWGSKEFAGLVLPFLSDKSEYVREVAIGALRHLTGKHFGFDPSANPEKRAQVVKRWRKYLEKK